MTETDATSYEGRGWSSFGAFARLPFSSLLMPLLAGVEYDPGPDGRITWAINGTETWELTAAAMGPDPRTEIGQRLVSMEPMVRFSLELGVSVDLRELSQSINLNLAISTKFQGPQRERLRFPGTFRIEYVLSLAPSRPQPDLSHSYLRVWQKGTPNIGCDPESHRASSRSSSSSRTLMPPLSQRRVTTLIATPKRTRMRILQSGPTRRTQCRRTRWRRENVEVGDS